MVMTAGTVITIKEPGIGVLVAGMLVGGVPVGVILGVNVYVGVKVCVGVLVAVGVGAS